MVEWNGSERYTTYITGTKVLATIGAEDIANAGSASVVVTEADTGARSNTATFTIQQAGPAPDLKPRSYIAIIRR